ncbi:MAG: pilin [Xanthomonadaceae bacterium]|nr:pilin [Xanthomonadaceae bacterium]
MMRAAASLIAAAMLAACGPGGEGGDHPAAYINRAEAAEAMIMLSAARIAVMQQYQVTGRWPTDAELAQIAPGVYAGDGTELKFDVEARTARGTLGLRYDPETRGWTCVAYDIPDASLPPNCRGG